MQIGINCFKDFQLKSIIQSENHKGHCDIKNEDNVLVYDTNITHENDLRDNISSILGVYTPESELDSSNSSMHFDKIENKIAENWNIFDESPENIRKIILSICKDDYEDSDKLFQENVAMAALVDSDFLSRNRITKNETWRDFSNRIKYTNRFHHDINLEILKDLFLSESLQVTLSPEDTYIRARINSGDKPYVKDEMGCPPPGMATVGRINPAGISCLYLADSVKTALNEVRARCHDTVAIGRFNPVENIKIIDLSLINQISPFSETLFDLEWSAVNMKVLKEMSEDLSKPLRRQDKLLDYLPSQYISEYIKYLGYDGIAFSSTVHRNGKNYAIFDSEKMNCKDVKEIYIHGLHYSY